MAEVKRNVTLPEIIPVDRRLVASLNEFADTGLNRRLRINPHEVGL
jgi:hypothetical protein